MLEFPDKFDGCPPVHPSLQDQEPKVWHGLEGLAADIEAYGKWMRDEAEKRIGHLYPEVKDPDGQELTPIAWIWARTVESPDPSWNGHVPIVSTWGLRQKKGRLTKPNVWIEPIIDRNFQTINYQIHQGDAPTYESTIERGKCICLATGSVIENNYIAIEAKEGRMKHQLMAVVAEGQTGRVYLPSTNEHIQAADLPSPDGTPIGKLESGMSESVTRYGFNSFVDLFTNRQLTSLTTFSSLISELKLKLRLDIESTKVPEPDAYIEALVVLFSLAISKCTNSWSSLTTWITSLEAIRNVFRRQAIGMAWDFAEVNPFSNSTGNWLNSVNLLKKAVRKLPTNGFAEVAQNDARIRLKNLSNVVVSTDPPYYDNIGYAEISDFFYVWLKQNLQEIFPKEFTTLLTPKDEELIADAQRHGSKSKAKKHFESGIADFMKEMAASQNSQIPATLFYAYKTKENRDGRISSTGWDTFLQSVVDSGMAVTATWPMRTESSNRPNANRANALASSVVLVCRPRSKSAPLASRSEFMSALQAELPDAVRLMQSGNIAPVDLPQSAIGPGIGVFSRYAKVVEADGSKMPVSEALALINDVLGEILDGQEAELDAETRFALAWYEQYGFEPESSGNADSIARAKNTSLQGIEDSGIGEARAGKFRLLKREELDPEWSPTTDSRLTIWEATQHMVLALEDSELRAAEILRELGGKADSVFQLIYVLYQKADHKGESQEAACYNGLAMAWPTLRAQSSKTQTEQTALEGTESQP